MKQQNEIEKTFDKDTVYRSAKTVIKNGKNRSTEIVGELKSIDKIKNYLLDKKSDVEARVNDGYLFEEFKKDRVKDEAALKLLKEIIKYLDGQQGDLVKEDKETKKKINEARVVASKIAKEDLAIKKAEWKLNRAIAASKKASKEVEKLNAKAIIAESKLAEARAKYEKARNIYNGNEEIDERERV